jgi:gas vesicle protein
MGVNDVLGLVGLARRNSAFGRLMPVVGWIGLGAVVGAGTALLLTPSSGREMRAKLSDKLDAAKSKVEGKLLAAEASVSHARDALSSNQRPG